jgi:hypothetical protein
LDGIARVHPLGEYALRVRTQGGCPDAVTNPEITLEQLADEAGGLPLPLLWKLASWLNWERGMSVPKSESSQESPARSDTRL